MNGVIRNIREELKRRGSARNRKVFQGFFKEKIKCHGVKSAVVGQIARKYWQEVKGLPKRDIFRLCEALLSTGSCEEAFIAADWCPRLSARFERGDLAVFKRWIGRYIDNWAKCDTFCNHTVGGFVEKYPSAVRELLCWTASPNRWMRRASAVSLIVPARRGKHLADVLRIADRMLLDPDDMVQKGYGWLLKVASVPHQQTVFNFVMKRRRVMPRTALRYAIELMPRRLKSRAMA